MSKKLRNLAERRKHLVAETSEQRLILAQNVEIWRAPLALADRGLAAVSYIKSHPIWASGITLGLLTAMRSCHAGKWFQRGWIVWQATRKLRGNHNK
jgi:hypothetical protein